MANITVPIQVNLPDDWKEQIVNRLRNDPESEWVEIIRCKDCRFYKTENMRCCLLDTLIGEHEYCSYAERRTDGTDARSDIG